MSLFARLYGIVVALRNYLYDKGVLDVHDLGAFTVSIGNITAGGTGKTPLVAKVAELLAEKGEKVCILTRGHGREDTRRRVLVSDGENILADARTGGDEPVELASKLLGKAIVIADADRVAAAEWAKRSFGVTAFVLDDAFQHRRAARDVNICCIDATDPFGGEALLPSGRLRESIASLGRADAIVVTRGEQSADLSKLLLRISDIAPKSQVFVSRTAIDHIRPLSGPAKTEALNDRKVFAFCGIGNPGNFNTLLRQAGLSVAGSHFYKDHHLYTQNDIDRIESAARQAGAEALLTTAKDAVKLMKLTLTIPCYVAEIRIDLDDAAGFASLVTSSR